MALKESTGGRRITIRKIFIAGLGVIFSLGGLIYAFNDVGVSQLLDTVHRIRFWPMVFSIVSYWGVLVVARALLVKYLLRKMGDISWIRAYRCLGIGFLANNILPLRMGDLARSAALAKAVNIPFSTVVGGMALERLLDMVMVAIIGFLALQVAPLPEQVRQFITWSGIILGVGFVVLIIVARTKMERNILGQNRIGKLVWTLWIKFSAGFQALENFRGVAVVLFLGVVIWAVGLANFSLRLYSFGLPAGIDHSLVLLTCLGAAVALPSAPGYLGVYHAAVRIAVVHMAGVDESIAVAFGLYSWVMDFTCGNLAGMLGMIFEGMKLGDLKRVGQLSDSAAE